ncbi:glycoside hydrolase/deacetylase [Basidiobolus meristosporus CBS 931.73]|uniref:Glycoside hydrolase/deacetylase n=1 Tax=Basidiobolus meristosporus CBS 931.73 TaxID=1314790 RepID=A0A1Y1YLB1_9FUNG|nr:glycoside hydrolase/deacetylase [Basidiobolus meristosporus CBS 931.73]|eukprot:ORX98799.1 glycoside hydrolase/deacetylase [Basidiobolus meristosporus CBS 931.73]
MYFSKAALLSIAVFLQLTATQARVSKDDRCGVINGEKVTCPSGECCSSYGWCGTSTDHCVTNCLFQCKKSKPTTTVKPTSTPKPTITTTTTAPAATQTVTSIDGTCGLKNNILVQCEPGNCCSQYGYCGSTEEYCKGTTPQPQPSVTPGKPTGNVVPGQVIETCSKAGTFAVTFDDGPSDMTGKLLDDLKKRNAKVTFFVVGQMLENAQGRQYLKRAYDEGHHIASHTYTHISLAKSSEALIRSEMQKTSDAIFKVIGKRPQYMRPPYGEYNAKSLAIMKDMGYKVIYWNVDTLDWQTKSSQKSLDVYKKTLAKANLKNDRFISLQHDIQPSTIQAAGGILDAVIKSGFKITTVADCLGDSGLYY